MDQPRFSYGCHPCYYATVNGGDSGALAWRSRRKKGGSEREEGETYAPEKFSGKCIYQRLRTL